MRTELVLLREVHAAAETGRRVVQVRVTTDALRRSPAALPITPERARNLARLVAVSDARGRSAGVIADPTDYERMLELLVHPDDWQDVLVDPAAYAAVQPSGRMTRWRGIPVTS